MSESIDRQYVIDRLKKAEDVFRQNGAKLEANGIHYALELIESDIEIPTIEPLKERPQGMWIPVSERLPENTGLYLVSVDELVTVASFTGTYFMGRSGFRIEVNAWQILPEPYKEEVKKNENA